MRPVRLRTRSLGVLEDTDLALQPGLTGILGQVLDSDGANSNGAGKSTLLAAIALSLFGDRSLAPYLTWGDTASELMVELTFEHDGELYRVRRGYSARGRGKTSCDFEHAVSEMALPAREMSVSGYSETACWEPLTCASLKETDALIEQTVGHTYETFTQSCYLVQRGNSWIHKKPADRKDFLTRTLLGPRPRWPQLLNHARDEHRRLDSELDRLAGETRALQLEAALKPQTVAEHADAVIAATDATVDLEQAEAALEAARARYQEARDQAALRQAAQAELDAATGSLNTLTAQAQKAAEASTDLTTARDELAALPVAAVDDLEAERVKLDTQRQAQRDRAAARREAAEARDCCERELNEARLTAGTLNDRASALRLNADAKRNDPHATCQTCEQPIRDEAKEKAVVELERLAEECEQKAADCDHEAAKLAVLVLQGDGLLEAIPELPPIDEDAYAQLGARIAAARAAEAQRARLEERIAACEQTLRDTPDIAKRVAQAEALVAAKQAALDATEAVDAETLLHDQRMRAAVVETKQRRLRETTENRARLEERLDRIRHAEQKLTETAVLRAAIQDDIDVWAVIEQGCNRDGVPAYIVENVAAPTIETHTNQVLQQIGSPQRVELRTQTTKTDRQLADTLDIIVIDPTGEETTLGGRAGSSPSGGETTRVELALQVALARMVGHTGLLMLDEPSYLDEAGMAALLEMLRGLQGEFELILLVSHVPALRDSFDQVLTVVKDGGRSRVEGAGVASAEGVAA